MQIARRILSIGALIFLLDFAHHAALAAESDALTTGPVALRGAIKHQQGETNPAFRLTVNCTDEKGIRSLKMFHSGAAIWGGNRQFQASAGKRRELLKTLLMSDFPSFQPLYGAPKKAEKAEAPLRVSCRIELKVDGLEQQSAQAVNGAQHEPLLSLAASLLDKTMNEGAAGTAVSGLSDGLSGIAEDRIAPETLTLRLLRLPERDSGEIGEIIRISGGEASRQSYAPGRVLTSPTNFSLSPATISSITQALSKSGFATWPINLPGAGMTELHVAVLGNDHTVTSRSYTRISPDARIEEGRALQALTSELSETIAEHSAETQAD